MKPTVGRIVHFFPSGEQPEPRAAIVTYVHSETMINLHAFGQDLNDSVEGTHTSVEQRAGDGDNYCWDWPPRGD